ncbi:GMC family oxidoreductase [Microvirga tunisiensis]|nr:GMC family oxidoreductase N-terminal domain-containing protein [Microvirga tunisiensis]
MFGAKMAQDTEGVTPDAGHWDYIIVGAGSAGSVVAARLSENASQRVLVLEAGPPDTPLLKAFGLGYYLNLSRYEWHYYSQPDPSRNMRTDHWRRGRVVGGTGSINGMNYVRGTRADYDRWAAMGNTGWSADDVMPLFASLERCEPGYLTPPDPRFRGHSGAISVREARHCHPLTEAYLESAQVVGFPWTHDYNGVQQEGVGYAQFNQRRGFRHTSADAFLKPALKRRNLKLVTNAHVHKLRLANRCVTGVIYEHNGEIREARAAKVVLCGGAINTPQILMLSGIGDANALQSLGIDVVIDRPQVGRNLMEHPILRTALRVNIPSFNPTGGLWQKVCFLTKFVLQGQGPIASVVETQGFVRSAPQEPIPDVQVLFSPFGAVFSNESSFYKSVDILNYPSVSIHFVKSYPKSVGQIRLASADPTDAPLIEPNLLGDRRDVETLVRCVDMFRRIVSTAPMANLVSEVIEPGPHISSHEQIVDYVRERAGLAYHPAGTCRMGADEDFVVTPDLRVRGIDNLWISDASVMPHQISGNIYAACMMIGEKLGRQLSSK